MLLMDFEYLLIVKLLIVKYNYILDYSITIVCKYRDLKTPNVQEKLQYRSISALLNWSSFLET